MAKIRLHIDPIGIEEKADEREWGRISRRVLKKYKGSNCRSIGTKAPNWTYGLPRYLRWLQSRRLARAASLYGGY